MSNLVLLLAVLITALACVCCLAIVSYKRITEQALNRALPEDVPEMLKTSGRTLTDLLTALRLRLRTVLPGTPNEGTSQRPSADGTARQDAVPGAEGAGQ
ncbi:hypothetical protein [Streptomyces spirodelae]|uniref:Uncharacterized protein n=1 Tax=Streptomyces spirodelae TaxID=2812904 RepID=A0ABS3X1I6_9ACTN|nr:hypothetical protein [Streptomyces spirodelae]MBO8189245.1 hypothetical protein [Streptomyces spirodelae]